MPSLAYDAHHRVQQQQQGRADEYQQYDYGADFHDYLPSARDSRWPSFSLVREGRVGMAVVSVWR
jgi:hypothetical protein